MHISATNEVDIEIGVSLLCVGSYQTVAVVGRILRLHSYVPGMISDSMVHTASYSEYFFAAASTLLLLGTTRLNAFRMQSERYSPTGIR
jgi:hypothetical protein